MGTLLNQMMTVASLFGLAISIGFFIAALKIKAEIDLNMSNQLKDIAVQLIETNNFNRNEDRKLAGHVRGAIDKISVEVKQNTREIAQIQAALGKYFDYTPRPRLPEDTLPNDNSSF